MPEVSGLLLCVEDGRDNRVAVGEIIVPSTQSCLTSHIWISFSFFFLSDARGSRVVFHANW